MEEKRAGMRVDYYGRSWETDRGGALRVTNEEGGYVDLDTYTKEEAPGLLRGEALDLEATAVKLREMALRVEGTHDRPD